jgi:hypothetical protein
MGKRIRQSKRIGKRLTLRSREEGERGEILDEMNRKLKNHAQRGLQGAPWNSHEHSAARMGTKKNPPHFVILNR